MKSLVLICVTLAMINMSACDVVTVFVLNLSKTTEFTVEGDRLLINGEINRKTLRQFEKIYANNPQIKTLVELDVPGSLDDDTMIELAYRVRDLGLNTYLTSNSKIFSGGVDLFLAGVKRQIEAGAIIGVHSWSDGFQDASEYPRDDPVHENNRKYIEDMLGDDSFYWFTIYAAPADAIYVMNEAEILKYKLATAAIIR